MKNKSTTEIESAENWASNIEIFARKLSRLQRLTYVLHFETLASGVFPMEGLLSWLIIRSRFGAVMSIPKAFRASSRGETGPLSDGSQAWGPR